LKTLKFDSVKAIAERFSLIYFIHYFVNRKYLFYLHQNWYSYKNCHVGSVGAVSTLVANILFYS